MHPFHIEHSPWAYRADFFVYGATSAAIMAWVLFASPAGQLPGLLALVMAGLAGWTLLEYVLHRYVLHGIRPFST